MVVLSKLQLLNNFPSMDSCSELHFAGKQHCLTNTLFCFLNAALACSKYYIPVYILQLALLGVKNLNQENVLKVLQGYLRSVCYGGSFGIAANGMICLSSALFGTIDIRTVFAIGLSAGCAIFWESKRNRRLNAYMLSTIALEVMVNELESSRLITRSPLRDTLKFMTINGLVMYFLARKKLKSFNFWFYDIEPIEENKCISKNSSKNKEKIQCNHKSTCKSFLEEGFKKYFIVGYAWNIIKLIMKKSAKMARKPKSIPFYLIKGENIKFATTLGLYAVIYRYITCNLLKIDPEQSAQRRAAYSAVAGAFAASTYIIEPNLQFGLTAVVTLLQIFYEKLSESTFTKEFWVKVPGAELSFIAMVTYLNLCYVANTPEFQKSKCKFIWDTFSGNIASKVRMTILKEMKLIST